MKIYEKPVVELVSFQAEVIMNDVDYFALNGYMAYSVVDAAAGIADI